MDPPYGILPRQEWDVSLKWDELWPELWRVLTPDGTIVIHTSLPFTVELVNTQSKHFRYWWTWHKVRKTGFLNAKRQPLRNIEEICVFYKRANKYRPQMVPLAKPKYRKSAEKNTSTVHKYQGGVVTRSTTEYPTTLLHFPSNTKSIKPEALCDYMIRTYTDTGDTVLDICMHTGVAGLAACKAERRFIGFEINEEFFAKAKHVLKNYL